jgi:glycosyltransferase involved in cell wall biosynthesis
VPVQRSEHTRTAAFASSGSVAVLRIALLTGGGDKPYALSLASSLVARNVVLDFIAGNDLDTQELRSLPGLHFLNLRGDQNPDARGLSKILRVLRYYRRLIGYAATAGPDVFHVLWNNKFELFDRTILMLFYRALGKRIVLTVHNVNTAARDGCDGLLNRASLRIQYALADHLFVHTEQMRTQLHSDFRVPLEKVTTIPFGINSTVPNTALTPSQAKVRLGLAGGAKIVLFFGNIAAYKGLEHALTAMKRVVRTFPESRLLIAGRPKGEMRYWARLQQIIDRLQLRSHIDEHIRYIPDEDVEIYFKAADVLVLPYTRVFQSGVLFLGYNFGLPVVATEVGAMKHEVIEGSTGFLCRPNDPDHLADVLERYFRSSLYQSLEVARARIRQQVAARNSWDVVSERTCRVYATLLTSEHQKARQHRSA